MKAHITVPSLNVIKEIQARMVILLCLALSFLMVTFTVNAQKVITKSQDTILPLITLNEVILISAKQELQYQKQYKPLSSLDEYLEFSRKVDMIKRGAYAWEPTLNNMTSERLSVTIDGMKVFGACTDKMDPITSYVDVSNLSKAHIISGQKGAAYGSTIGGAINLELDKSNFKGTGFKASIENSYETNNKLKVIGAEANFSNTDFYVDSDIVYRKAENYSDGDGKEIAFSQYEKYNVSINGGYKTNPKNAITATLIFDEAHNIGYPALPMDVSLARALITSIGFENDSIGAFSNFKSKIYYNTVTHIMDDSKRPDVPIRMDMPGWSDTYGFMSEAKLKTKKHSFLLKWDGFYNQSLAEMTMYPNNPNERSMFMLTWPDIRTLNSGIYAEDDISFKKSSFNISTRVAIQNSTIADEFGLNSLKIFYPNINKNQVRVLKSLSVQWHKNFVPYRLNFGLSYGDRAPSVSEAYGFYLFNSFDNHDYIGDPKLKNEESLEANAKISIEKSNYELGIESTAFRMPNYIIGEIDTSLSTMTIGADGVKIYKNLTYANLINVAINGQYKIFPELVLDGQVSYHRGKDNKNRNLPFISPLSYSSSIQYNKKRFSGTFKIRGAAKQVNFNSDFGEDQTLAYTVFSLNFGKTFYLNNDLVYAKMGVENLFDKKYSTYTDWKNIPRMGRNFFITLTYSMY